MVELKMSEIKKYYDLQENPENQEQYFKFLKKLSRQTTSREFFTLDNGQLETKRKQLHREIINKYISTYKTQSVPRLYFIIGSIGSGKTSLKDTVVQRKEVESFLYINFDDLKKQLPEYQILKKLNPKKAAQFVQSESAKLAGILYKKSTQKKVNIIYEKNLRIGKDNTLHVVEEIKKAFRKDYNVSIHIVFLESYQEAWRRVRLRYEKIKRYVSKKEVFDTFQNLFPNLNKLLNIQFKSKAPIKIWIWYNGLLEVDEIDSEKKAHLIGLIGYNGPNKDLERLYDQFKDENIVIADKTIDLFVIFVHHRLAYLPTTAKKIFSQLDCVKKILPKLINSNL